MRITVIFAPLFSELVRTEKCTIDVDIGTSVRGLLEIITNEFGQSLGGIIPSNNDPPGILIVRNQRIVRRLDEELSDGDSITFIVPPTGG